jgi:catechol 2,3-dioxygenase-like lactoylglutathione lyase family enzyme
MAMIKTFDHCGVVVEDIPRAQRFYNKLLGAKPLWIANLNTHKAYQGWAIISFVEMGGHRFELCLAQHPLPDPESSRPFPRIGFSVTDETMEQLLSELKEAGIAYEPIVYPDTLGFKRVLRVRDPDGNPIEFCTRV